MKDKPIVLIMCGGRSKRLWPVSQYRSKNFFDIFGFSPLRQTVKRFRKVTSLDKIFCVTGLRDKPDVEQIKELKKSNIIVEPESKNTAPAILLALLKIKKIIGNQDSGLIISPVDHLIKKEKSFYKALNTAIAETKKEGICTLGIKPSSFNPDFGYIQAGRKQGSAYAIKKFIEKPGIKKAKRLLRQGNCFYNSGIFISSIGFLLNEYKTYYSFYKDFKLSLSSKKRLGELYKKIEGVPFDKVIMEETTKAKLVKADFYWQDFGSWQTIYDLFRKDRNKNAKQGEVLIDACKGNFFFLSESGKKVLAVGLKDVFFIDTPKYSLLVDRNSTKKIKPVLEKFRLG